MSTGLLPRLTQQLNDILNGDKGLPSPLGKLAEFFLLGERLDQLARLSEVELLATDPNDLVIGADLIAVPDPLSVLPGAAPHNVGQVLRDYAIGVGGVMPAPAGIEGAVVVEIDAIGTRNSRRLRLSQIDADFAVATFAVVGGSLQELGSTLTNPSFTATYTNVGPLISATVIDDAGGILQSVIGSPAAFSYVGVYTSAIPGFDIEWTLTGAEAISTGQGTVTATWVNRVYYGTAVPAAFNEAFILALGTSPLQQARGVTFQDTPGATEHIYYAEPSRFDGGSDEPVFVIGLLESIWVKVATVSVTNASGYAELYDLWQTTNPGLGLTTIEVI